MLSPAGVSTNETCHKDFVKVAILNHSKLQ